METRPLDQLTPDELRLRIVESLDELVRRAATSPKRKPPDIAKSCENWIRGHAWDETFTPAMVEDELAVHERKLGQDLQPLERERLLQLWRALFAERYPKAA